MKHPILSFTAALLLALFSGTLHAQVNNECTGASTIAFGTPFPSSNAGASQSLPPNSCNGFVTPAPAKDVWFKFTYAAGMDSVLIDPGPNPDADIVAELFSGTCSNPVPVTCSNFAEQLSSNQSEGFYLTPLGLVEGATYYFRVYGSAGIETPFTVLIKSAGNPPPPANDECQTAQLISAGQILTGNSIGATQSQAPIACNGFTSSSAKDVWFRFTKSPTMQNLQLITGTTDFVLQIFSGNCSNLTSAGCSDNAGAGSPEDISIAGISNGTQCYARVYGRNGTSGNFFIKITSPPLNDNCSTAGELIPNMSQMAKTVDATQSAPPGSCGGTSDDDVWFTFVKASNMDSIVVTPDFSFNPVLEIRSAPCSSSVAISCQHTGGRVKLPVSQLSPNTRYFVRVYSHSGAAGNFSIRLFQSTGAIPPNDQCSNAEAINPAIGAAFTGNNSGATQSFPAVPCGGTGSSFNADVWYSFVRTPARDSLKIDAFGMMDVMADIRSGCSADSLVACLDREGTDIKTMDLSELQEGKTYLLRIYGRNAASGDFSLKFLENTFVPAPPPNNDCFTATLLTIGSSCSYLPGTTVSSDATAGLALPGCISGTGKDVWYRFQATASKAIVRISCAPGFDGAIQILTGNCFSPSSLSCVNDFPAGNDPDFPVEEELIISGLTTGQFYFIRVIGNNGSTGNFSICAFHPNCNSTAAGLSLSTASVISNQAFTASLTNAQGLIIYQFSSGGGSFKPLAESVYNNTDTLVFSTAAGGNYSFRAMSRNGECYPAFSNAVALQVNCATPFFQTIPEAFIKQVKISGLNNSSERNPLGGSVQDFSVQSATVCKGASYVLSLKPSESAVKVLAWGDFNQDGDFSDAGENLVSAFASDTLLRDYNVLIPAAAASGSCRLRVMIVKDTLSTSGTLPCAEGPYLSGEIEEYSLSVSSGSVAAAGADQNSGCSGSASLSGNSPGAGNSGIWTLVSGLGDISNPGSANTVVNNLGPGSNIFRWSLSNSCGTSSDEVSISSVRAVALAGPDFTACGSSVVLTAYNPSPGSGTWTVLEGPAILANPAQYNSLLSNLAPGPNKLRWSVSSTGCPSSSDTIVISSEPNPLQLGNDTVLCEPFSLTLTGPGSGVSSYLWSTGSTGSSISVNEFGLYWLQVSTSGVCVFRDSISVDNCNAIASAMENAGFSIYPNPGRSEIFLSSPQHFSGKLELEFFDAKGRRMYQKQLDSGSGPFVIDQEIPPGMYQLRLKKDGIPLAAFRWLRE